MARTQRQAATRSADWSAAPFVPTGSRVTLRQLKAAAELCRGCPLYKHATQVVFGERAAPAGGSVRIMFVGEQPGDQEDIQGRPFVGPAGQLLDTALKDAGIDRADVYVTNAVKHFKWTPSPRGKRRLHAKPVAAEVRACRPWLEREVDFVRPAVIVSLGATAGQSLAGRTFRVGALRGRALDVTIGDSSYRLVATIHPSAILRMPDKSARDLEYTALVRDLRHAAAIAKEKEE